MQHNLTMPQRLTTPLQMAVAVALCVGAPTALAQSLKDLYTAAADKDVTFVAARAEAQAARYRAEQAKALFRPNVSLQVNASRNFSGTPDAPGTTAANNTTVMPSLQLQQSLFNRASSLSQDQAERAAEIASAQLRAAEQDLMVRLAQAYFDVLYAQEARQTVQAAKKGIAEQLAAAKRSFEIGAANITDTREAQSRFDLAIAQEMAADNDLRVKQVTLDDLVGQQGVQPFPLARPVVLPKPEKQEAEQWAQEALNASPALQQARLALDIARLESDKAKAGHWPTAGLSASLGRGRMSSDSDITTAQGPGQVSFSTPVTSRSVGVNLSIPLYSGGATSNKIKEATAAEEKAKANWAGAQRSVQQAARQTFLGVQTLQGQVAALEVAESSSKLSLEAIQLGYKVGVRVNLDVLNAQTQLYTTQRDLAKARYDTLVTGLRLKQTVGTLAPADLFRVNDLLQAPKAP